MSTWSAPVRYAECDQQGIVFNAHYLLYCDEAMGAFCEQHGLGDLSTRLRLATSTLTWRGPARWGDVVEVSAACTHVGRTSLTVDFDVRADGRACCEVRTVYVHADDDGTPQPLDDAMRAALGHPQASPAT